ncbi:tyrosine kinase domain protein [Rhizoctonia solani 123E]|uniref:Tyrosine kinase domain protein n=1 Tax=Rhizoctonia solani 123E TaxID=1423351 RepID=A0A074RLM6_9AGAM|nr:tyrosine kinase domain protein [Rhizoctonia solani 123E]
MFQLLFEHGCKDLSSQIDPAGCSEYPVGGGGYGDIYKGKTQDGTDVAIKVLRRSSSLDPKSVKHAMREVHRWSKARHPNIHELMGVIDFRGQLGMVSLWMEHGDLRSFILKNPEVDRYPWCIQVAAGVSYLHTNDMVQLSALCLGLQMNILVSKDTTVRISDFDCSIISDSSLLFSATGQATSLRYAAPELMGSEDDEVVVEKTCQSDVYALGMEIVTGAPPYSEYPLDFGVMKALAHGKFPKRPPVLSKGNRKDAFWNLLVQCWNSDRAVRPSAQRVLTRVSSQSGTRF